MPDPRPDITRGEFASAAVSSVAAAVLFSDMVMAPYPSPDVCLATAAVSLLVTVVAGACFALLRWKRGRL